MKIISNSRDESFRVICSCRSRFEYTNNDVQLLKTNNKIFKNKVKEYVICPVCERKIKHNIRNYLE